jgi:bile acid-coenzyme A ligase
MNHTAGRTEAEPDAPLNLAPDTPYVSAIREFSIAYPDRPALTDAFRTVSWGELESETNRLARAYSDLGVTEGSFVTIAQPNDISMVLAMVATWKLGATAQPVSFRMPQRDLEAVVRLVKPSLLVGMSVDGVPSITPDFVADPQLSTDPLPLKVSGNWKAVMSGGSTGTPKVIVADQEARIGAVTGFVPLVGLPVRGATLIPTPMAHNSGVIFSALSMMTGGHTVIMPRFDAAEALRLIALHHIQFMMVAPTILHRIARLPQAMRDAADLSSIVKIATSAGPCPQWLKEFWVDWLGPDRMLEFYSTAENQVAGFEDGRAWIERPGSVGRLVLGEIEIRDEDGTPVPDGTVGEMWQRRSATNPGPYFYIGAKPHRDANNWETVGDMGWMSEGYIYLADRKIDMVIVGGANVYPAEVEGALDEHPLVASSCVVGVPDDEYGSILYAYVQTTGDVSDDELVRHLRERVLPYKVPRVFERSAEPLRDDAGKVRRSILRERAMATRGSQ